MGKRPFIRQKGEEVENINITELRAWLCLVKINKNQSSFQCNPLLSMSRKWQKIKRLNKAEAQEMEVVA
jgi:hypothetical protein